MIRHQYEKYAAVMVDEVVGIVKGQHKDQPPKIHGETGRDEEIGR